MSRSPVQFRLGTLICAATTVLLTACGGGGAGGNTAGTDMYDASATHAEANVSAGAETGNASAAQASAADSTATSGSSGDSTAGSTGGSTGGSTDGSTGGSTGGSTTSSGTRDPMKWPFAANSIWNMPIGSNAVYVAANLPAVPGGDNWAPMPQIDDERIVMRPTAPSTAVNYSDAGWSGKNRCNATGSQLISVPIPSDYVVPNGNDNSSAVFLQSDGRTLIHMQPFTRCSAGGSATALVKFNSVDLYGDGAAGSHGGSGLSAIGGSLRIGELRPGQQGPRHALKINVYAKQALFKCSSRADCYRWPATTADSYAVGFYGTANNNSNRAMKMGSLLAIPTSKAIASLSLETEPGKQLAWTLQNYGAYIVDDTYGPAFALNAENGPDGSMRTQFKADWGMDFEQRVNNNTAWSRDLQKLMQALYVVDNNGPSNIGGGGTPLQPMAPAFK